MPPVAFQKLWTCYGHLAVSLTDGTCLMYRAFVQSVAATAGRRAANNGVLVSETEFELRETTLTVF